MVVWAVNLEYIDDDTTLKVTTHLRSQIGFLQAQDGLFLYDSDADIKYIKHGQWLPFEFELKKLTKRNGVLQTYAVLIHTEMICLSFLS